jgi:hypothetical protein
MSAKKGPALIDPEPFTMIVGVAGIVGGVASVIATLKSMAKESPVAIRQAALELLDQGADELRDVSADLETIREVLADAEVSDDRRFRLETVAFLKRSQFARYERTTDQMYARLRRLLKITNKLDPLLPRLPDISVGEASRQIGDARGTPKPSFSRSRHFDRGRAERHHFCDSTDSGIGRQPALRPPRMIPSPQRRRIGARADRSGQAAQLYP